MNVDSAFLIYNLGHSKSSMVIDSSYRPLESDDYYSRIQHSQSFHKTFFKNRRLNIKEINSSFPNLAVVMLVKKYVGEEFSECWLNHMLVNTKI